MRGVIVIEGLLDPLGGAYSNLMEQFVLLYDLQISNGSVPGANNDSIDSDLLTNRFVSGEQNPTIQITPNELQLWRIANIGPDIFTTSPLAALLSISLLKMDV